MTNNLDIQILSKLEQMGYIKNSDLSKLLLVNERTVRRHISEMIEGKLIKITAVCNPVLCGYKVWAKIGLKVELRFLRNVAHALAGNPSIYFVAYTLGSFDFIIGLQLENIDSLTDFIQTDLASMPGIQNSETMILTNPRKYYHFSWGNKGNYPASTATIHVDELDRNIVKILSEDALVSSEEIKSRIGGSVSTIHRRITRMLKEEVIKIEVVPNPDLLKRHAWATIGINVAQQNVNSVIDKILDNSMVYLVSMATGRFNIIVAARFPDIDDLTTFSNKELLAIKGVNSVESLLHNKVLKYHNVNWMSPLL